jgi:hypothetical protein
MGAERLEDLDQRGVVERLGALSRARTGMFEAPRPHGVHVPDPPSRVEVHRIEMLNGNREFARCS